MYVPQSIINLTLVTIGVDTYICICKDAVWCGLWRWCLVDCRYLIESSFVHLNKASFMGRTHIWPSMDVQQLLAVKFKEVITVMAVFNRDYAIVGYIWLATESDWPLESSIRDSGTDSKPHGTGILVLFKLHQGLVDFLWSMKLDAVTYFCYCCEHSYW